MKVQFKSSYRVFTICLILSAISWLFLNFPKEYVNEVKIPIEYCGFFENKIRLKQSAPQFVKINLKGTGFDFLFSRFYLQPLKLSIHYKDLRWNKSTQSCSIALQDWVDELSWHGLKLENISPASILLSGDTLKSKKVPVKLNATLNFKNQYRQHGAYKLSPAEIEIYGTEPELEKIDFVETQHQTFSHLEKTKHYTLALQSPLANTRCLVQDSVQFTLPVSQYTEASIELPIASSHEANRRMKFFPDKIQLNYTIALEDYKKIAPDMFTITTRPLQSENNKMMIEISQKPDFIEIVKVNPEIVEYLIFE